MESLKHCCDINTRPSYDCGYTIGETDDAITHPYPSRDDKEKRKEKGEKEDEKTKRETHLVQVPHNLVKSGREGAVNVAEEALSVGKAEGAAEADVRDERIEGVLKRLQREWALVAASVRRRPPARARADHGSG